MDGVGIGGDEKADAGAFAETGGEEGTSPRRF